MNRREAADILADYIIVRARQRGLSDLSSSTLIAECISEARYEKPAGTYLHTAGTIRPADRTIRTALKQRI